MGKLAHLQLDLIGCGAELDNLEYVTEMLEKVCEVLELDIRERTHHHFTPQGLTVIFIIAESHISYHSWPEYDSCFIDVFTCGEVSPEKSIPVFNQYVKPEKVITRNIERLYEVNP